MPPEGVLTKIATKVWGGYRKVADDSRSKGTPILGAECQMVTGKGRHPQGNKDSVGTTALLNP